MDYEAMKAQLSMAYESLQSLQMMPTRKNLETLLQALCLIQEVHNALPAEEGKDVQADIE